MDLSGYVEVMVRRSDILGSTAGLQLFPCSDFC